MKVTEGTNNYAISMTDMAEATKEAASIAANYGVSIEQLSALITMAVSKTRQSGSEAGNALKALFVNLSDVTNKERMKAFETLGVDVYKFVDGVKQVKTPIELLGELSEVFNSLSEGDEKRNILLNDIGTKHHANTLAAILQDWQSMEGVMNTYYEGMGSAEKEAEKSANNLSGNINRLKNSITDLVQDFADAEDITTFFSVLDKGVSTVDTLIEKFGLLKTTIVAISAIKFGKNIGRTKLLVL